MRGKVLIVEDYSDWRELLRDLLRREGHAVKAVADLQEAQSYLREAKDLDVAILDIRLVETDETNEDGMRLLQEIHDKHDFVRVIMITGHGNMELQRKAFRQFHAFDFFRKEQFVSDEFRQAVREATEEAHFQRRAQKGKDYIQGHRYEMWQRQQSK
jgi:DNA-binding NtrC family response regulator